MMALHISIIKTESACLYQYGLQLLDTGRLVNKKVLELKFIFVWNECFSEMHTHHPPVRF